MSRSDLQNYIAQCLDQLELGYHFDGELQAFVIVDQYGHQVSIRARKAPPLAEEAGDELLVEISLPLLLDSATEDPLMWRRLAQANAEAPFVRFSVNEYNVIAVSIDLFAEGFDAGLLARALMSLSQVANQHGDVIAEWFDGRRAFWKPGRRSGQ